MISNWSHINTEKYNETPELFETLRTLYGENGLLNIDLYIGGMWGKINKYYAIDTFYKCTCTFHII